MKEIKLQEDMEICHSITKTDWSSFCPTELVGTQTNGEQEHLDL